MYKYLNNQETERRLSMCRVQAINSFILLIVLILVMLVSAPVTALVEALDLPGDVLETMAVSIDIPYKTQSRITVPATIAAICRDHLELSQAPAPGLTIDTMIYDTFGNGNDPAIKVNAGKIQGVRIALIQD